ncbi:alpha/beta hydrolase [Pigmentiphaga sp. YJ18]|uniref:alpha/beta hydrolase n=1 Tax=Pigmentiphaga sp. YJ18 TaxID=3134907 RepID=UPI0031138A01
MLRPEHHSSDRSEANVAAMLFNANALGDACLRNPLVKYINTDATVRDMDLIRELLGDAKFNYVGISYGTWLGAWYASLFPERVGRVVLDSSMDVTGNIDVNVVMQPMAMQRVLDEFISPFAARHPDRFGIGTDAAKIANVYRALPEPMRVAFGQQAGLHAILSKTNRVAKGAQLIAAARGMNQVLIDNPGIDDSRELDAKLMEYEFVPDSFGDDIEIRGMAQAMIEPYFRAFTPTPSPVELSTFNSVFNTVVCNDTVATSTDPQYWVKLGNEMAASYPYEGGSVTRSLCATWGGPSVAKPPLSRAGASAPILMLQSEFDAQTATEGARRSFDALPQAHLVVVTGAYSHGVVPESNACVDATIGTYFANGVVPGRSSTCAEPPLPYEDTAAATRMAKASAGETEEAAQAREALRRSLDAISGSGARF